MLQIRSHVVKTQKNFWNHCVFHPTDAVEDPWARRILDKMAEDKAIRTVRIYSMFEDIAYLDEEGRLCCDFRLSDLRLDYLTGLGFDLTIAYAGIPDCLTADIRQQTTVCKNETRYKGKMWNAAPPKDYALWEELCYEYTKHIVERYGLQTVKRWHLHCFNEPDWAFFFLSELDKSTQSDKIRSREYLKLYAAFARGVCRVSEELKIGGPALAGRKEFLGHWLDGVRENRLKLDFVTVHSYGTSPKRINTEATPFCAESLVDKQKVYRQILADHGFADTPCVIDEWGMSASGFCDKAVCPALMARETEVFSAYFAKLIYRFIHEAFPMEKMMICLSGQHEMTEDFTGFRNFFSLNFIAKPIYNAFVLAGKLHEGLLEAETEDENLFAVPTKDENGNLAVLLTYCTETFAESLPATEQTVVFEDDISTKTVTVWCIDRTTTNPYRRYQAMGIGEPTAEELRLLREEGRMKPILVQPGNQPLTLRLTANCTYLITAE